MPSLADRLRERIAREGPISFSDFMRAALYDPDEGYYSRGGAIGEPGDFVTSPHVSPAFAATIARLFARDAAAIAGTVDFVEVGSGAGRFLADFAAALSHDAPQVAGRVRLTAVERSRAGRGAIERLSTVAPLRALADAGELPEGSVAGWIFSNELYDAEPVDRVRGGADGLVEERVSVDGERFVWTPVPAAVGLAAYAEALGIRLEPGQAAELGPDAALLHRRLARALRRGRVVAFDYGHRRRVLHHPLARRNGTLAVHSLGRRGGDPLESPGAHDLTAHVDWDALIGAGEAEGLTTDGLVRQGRFLIEAGIFDFAKDDAEKWRIYRLVDPNGMGEELSALIQSRGMPTESP